MYDLKQKIMIGRCGLGRAVATSKPLDYHYHFKVNVYYTEDDHSQAICGMNL